MSTQKGSAISIKEDIGYDAVRGIIKRNIETEVDWEKIKKLGILGILGIDEISLKKGHKDFVTIVTSNIDGKIIILAVLKDRKRDTVKDFLLSIPKRLRRTVKAICSDMYDGFINPAKEVFGKKIIVVDRFHVAKFYRSVLDKLRVKELKRLKKIRPEKEYEKLKNVMWILRKKNSDLTKEKLNTLDFLFQHSPDVKKAYEFCNELTGIFDENLVRSRAKRELESWMKRVKNSGIKRFKTFLGTLTKRMNEILNYFRNRNTSGFVEGLNNKIKG